MPVRTFRASLFAAMLLLYPGAGMATDAKPAADPAPATLAIPEATYAPLFPKANLHPLVKIVFTKRKMDTAAAPATR